MLKFQEPPKEYNDVFLEDTDKPLPKVLNQNTRYMFLSTIAKGGKSLIKTCKDMHLNRVVAYKTLRSEFVDDEIENIRLLREARVSAMLQHPNTVPIYEIGRDNRGHYYFTMKLVHGYTLREILNYRERYDLTQLVEVVVRIAHALGYAHVHGVAHRDIKPENILVGPYNEVLLMDWGLAKVWRKDGTTLEEPGESKTVADGDKSITGYGKLQGTLCYMSPEQIRRDPDISFSTDIYSLGSVLYELLTGQTPFDSDKTYEILEMVENRQPERPSEVSKYALPKVLEDLCMRCLAKDPASRPESMTEVIRTLEHEWASVK
ncbi:MAG: serine/threonine protein kinase [Candidatus Thiodiazotropha lotti]|uniref:Protein kinase domain-containing protein n=1 Tax=Candidatus Thiodiazotropha endoloripes TaxID=1818881 RepID=A0A1E2UPK2_9GAMM|nr:serine/threonine-protein kinase [Candidatus Thiodiazotropha endoloripes]MCG7899070.1 serine/threonine protein kinase [Candidatus Thiodiazotropha weberae]MCG7993475.1 serine/threonine protein kinase [Candidatus Thiodiazotropha lotti]MCG7901153.1 serine/threonine protein kinase [Candidatus Thiodiazotropha weberae]MCG7913247.1 serine/threonine protein kinase [Candidatus Thiodiazotropha weberae]MCG7998006.1 serine/threonine protein kinase [Candidatus Thiodiazotropha lotti]